MDGPDESAGKVAWAQSVQREEQSQQHHSQQQQSIPAGSPPPDEEAVANAAARSLASNTPAPSATTDMSSFTLFPSLLSPSPHHHQPSHSIIALSAAPPSTVPPSPLLSDSPAQPQQMNHLATDHILNNPNLIVNVWQSNLQEELAKILHIVDEYPFIAMDTEFPGIVARPAGSHKTSNDYQYQTLRTNVDLLKIIQLGLCFCDADGNIHPGTCTWQFNFQFSLTTDMYAQDSIDLLAKSGIDFSAHERDGIHTADFAEWLMTSGIVLNEEVKWISFHSGFDFGYLLKILTCQPLPSKEEEFFALLQIYFPCIYDIKYLMDSCANLHGGLSKIAETLNVIRIGPQHQAGSDSLLTAATFFKLKSQYFNSATNPIWGETPENRHARYRELKTHNNNGQVTQATYSVITNTDPLNEFDTKFMGHLAGLNNDWTSDWKKKQEFEREKRHVKEKAIATGQVVSSDDEDDEPMLDGKSSTTTSTLNSSTSSPNFIPSTASNIPTFLPMTPQKAQHQTHHSYTSSSPSPHSHNQHDHYSHANNTTGANSKMGGTPNKNGMLRSHRYSHDYS